MENLKRKVLKRTRARKVLFVILSGLLILKGISDMEGNFQIANIASGLAVLSVLVFWDRERLCAAADRWRGVIQSVWMIALIIGSAYVAFAFANNLGAALVLTLIVILLFGTLLLGDFMKKRQYKAF